MSREAERVTRNQRIDPRLTAAEWTVATYAQVQRQRQGSLAVEEYETTLGPADYVLTHHAALLGVVEAKKLTLGPQGVLPQAERYAEAIESDHRYQGKFGVPFLYSTNGQEI